MLDYLLIFWLRKVKNDHLQFDPLKVKNFSKKIDQNFKSYLLDSEPFSDFDDLELRSDDKDSRWETVSRQTGINGDQDG